MSTLPDWAERFPNKRWRRDTPVELAMKNLRHSSDVSIEEGIDGLRVRSAVVPEFLVLTLMSVVGVSLSSLAAALVGLIISDVVFHMDRTSAVLLWGIGCIVVTVGILSAFYVARWRAQHRHTHPVCLTISDTMVHFHGVDARWSLPMDQIWFVCAVDGDLVLWTWDRRILRAQGFDSVAIALKTVILHNREQHTTSRSYGSGLIPEELEALIEARRG